MATKKQAIQQKQPEDLAARVAQLEEMVCDLAEGLQYAQPRDQVMIDKARGVREKFKG